MAIDKRFAIARSGYSKSIPTEKQQAVEWTKLQFVKGLQANIKKANDAGKGDLAYKWATLLAKVQKFDEQQNVQRPNNIMFVTQYENQRQWEQATKEHAKRIEEIDVKPDLATNTEEQSGADDSDES